MIIIIRIRALISVSSSLSLPLLFPLSSSPFLSFPVSSFPSLPLLSVFLSPSLSLPLLLCLFLSVSLPLPLSPAANFSLFLNRTCTHQIWPALCPPSGAQLTCKTVAHHYHCCCSLSGFHFLCCCREAWESQWCCMQMHSCCLVAEGWERSILWDKTYKCGRDTCAVCYCEEKQREVWNRYWCCMPLW